MPRLLRVYLFGCIAIALAFLALHIGEPLRLNVGDAWSDAATVSSVEHLAQDGVASPVISDAYRPTHDPSVGMIYRALASLGLGDVVALRLVALAVSLMWAWLMFHYARRVWGEPVALLATALLASGVLWLMYADSIARPPLVQACCFLALWGVAGAIDTHQRRHYAAVLVGSFGCWFGGFDGWGLLLAGVAFTVSIKRGSPLARGGLRFLGLCALGALAALVAKAVFVVTPADWYRGAVDWQAAIDRRLVTQLPTLVRRYALLFTPMFWITLGHASWRALRAPSPSALIGDGTTWLLAVAAVALYLASPQAASPMLRAQPLLPFYAIATALLIARLLDGRRPARGLAVAWAVTAPAWGLCLMLSHPRSVLARADVAQVRAYLAASDRNDFVMSNLLADGPLQAAFGRHNWSALELDNDSYTPLARLQMLNIFDATGADYVHAVIFTTPESRFIDRSLGQLVARGRFASVTGWPFLVRRKANQIIRDYDKKVRKSLDAVGAKEVLHLSDFGVYRIERASVLALAGEAVPVTREIDFTSPSSSPYKLLGWDSPQLTPEDRIGATTIVSQLSCANPLRPRAGQLSGNACETMPTELGLTVMGDHDFSRAQLMIRVARACDLRVTLDLTSPTQLEQLALDLSPSEDATREVERAFAIATVEVAMNDFTSAPCEPAKRVSFIVPQRAVSEGINVLTVRKKWFGRFGGRTGVVALAIEPVCEPRP